MYAEKAFLALDADGQASTDKRQRTSVKELHAQTTAVVFFKRIVGLKRKEVLAGQKLLRVQSTPNKKQESWSRLNFLFENGYVLH